MSGLFSDEIKSVIRCWGNLVEVDNPEDEINAISELNDIQWMPQYLYKGNDFLAAVDIFRGDYPPDLEMMRRAREAFQRVRPVVFVPEEEDLSVIQDSCRKYEIPIIAKIDAKYELVELTEASLPPRLGTQTKTPHHFSPEFLDRLILCENLSEKVRLPIEGFRSSYVQELQSGLLNEEKEIELLKTAFDALAQTHPDFGPSFAPLELMAHIERDFRYLGLRDHFFHTFHNYLLGLLVINGAKERFQEYHDELFPQSRSIDFEYVWLLCALFHDVGYTHQLSPHILQEEIGFPLEEAEDKLAQNYGIPALEIGKRQRIWDSMHYRMYRRQLCSLFEHFCKPRILTDWVPELSDEVDSSHPLDKAMTHSYLYKGHGAASCFRLLAEAHKLTKSIRDNSRNYFVYRHFILAGLSMAFHDYPVRQALIKEGVIRLSTKRFPFAGLLMFLDEIQEDRRELTDNLNMHDSITDLVVDGSEVKAVVDVGRLSKEVIETKRVRLRHILEFLNPDGFRFFYPEDLL